MNNGTLLKTFDFPNLNHWNLFLEITIRRCLSLSPESQPLSNYHSSLTTDHTGALVGGADLLVLTDAARHVERAASSTMSTCGGWEWEWRSRRTALDPSSFCYVYGSDRCRPFHGQYIPSHRIDDR
jgi:hypothetical protein